MRRALVMFCVLVVGMPFASAQPRGDRRGGDQGLERREAIKKRIRVLRAATLTDDLDLDEKALAKLLPALAKWDDVTEDLLKKRIELQRLLQAADAVKDPKGVDRMIDAAVVNQKAFWELEEKRLAELRKILTPGQIARLLIVLPAFERKIQNQLRRAITRRNALDEADGTDPDDAPPQRRR